MKISLKHLALISTLLVGVFFGIKAVVPSSCCATDATTSGCSPSSCRGAQTKFGEAQAITDLRADLIALKADMEQSKTPVFNARAFDIHGIVGDSDDESLEIIAREVEIIETAFEEKLDFPASEWELPANKAQQVKFLSERIESLQQQL